MSNPDVLESGLQTVGFQKSKIGSGEKEEGYVIGGSKLRCIAGGLIVSLVLLGIVGVWSQFEVGFEKRSLHRKLRKEEHHAASKLAQVEMQLWSHYHEDIEESKEAHNLLVALNQSYADFQDNLQVSVKQFAKELSLKDDMAASLADRILKLVAELQLKNTQHAQHLVDHLVAQGKKGAVLEKHAHQEAVAEVKEEVQHMKEDAAEGEGSVDEDEEGNGLKAMLDGFWATFKDYEREFSGTVRAKLSKKGNKQYRQLTELLKKIMAKDSASEQDVMKGLDQIDLAGVGAGLGSGRVLPAHDIVEELYLVPKIPHEKLEKLEVAYRTGKKDPYQVFEELTKLQEHGLIPSGWMQQGVQKDEEEDRQEQMEEDEEEAENQERRKKQKRNPKEEEEEKEAPNQEENEEAGLAGNEPGNPVVEDGAAEEELAEGKDGAVEKEESTNNTVEETI